MTGRRLYELHCHALKEKVGENSLFDPIMRTWSKLTPPVAWAFLDIDLRRTWNATARNLTMKRGTSA